MVVERFQELFSQGNYKEAAELAAECPQGILRNRNILSRLLNVPVEAGQTPPALRYFVALLTRGPLEDFESLESSRLVLNLDKLLAEGKLECTEELGDHVKLLDNDVALKIYIQARATAKVIAAYTERKEFGEILSYSEQVGYTPDYLSILRGMLQPELQYIYGLHDIKRVIVNTHAIEPQSLVEFFGTLSPQWTLECMKHLLKVNVWDNLGVVVNTAKRYSERLGMDACIRLFEQFESYYGLCSFLEPVWNLSEDPDIHFKYIKASCLTGHYSEVLHVLEESNIYDRNKTHDFLLNHNTDGRHLHCIPYSSEFCGFVPAYTQHLYATHLKSQLEEFIKFNRPISHLVLGQLLDDWCDEDFIRETLALCTSHNVQRIVEEFEKRDRLPLLTEYLELIISKNNENVHAHNGLAKIKVNKRREDPRDFLTTNTYYDSRVIGEYCERRYPELAIIAYRRGQCDDEFINVTNKNSLFLFQASYVVERMDVHLWTKVLDPNNGYRQQFIDKVVSTALPECTSLEQVSTAVRAFTNANLLDELVEVVQKIVLQDSPFCENFDLQTLLIQTAIKAGSYNSRVTYYIAKLDNFDGPAVGAVAVEAQLYEEAFAIFKKFHLNVQAVNVLLDNIQSIERAVEFTFRVEEEAVWSQVAKAQLREGLISDAIESFIRAEDATQFLDVIRCAEDGSVYHHLVRYLLMVRQKITEPKVDSELIYAYAKIDRLNDIEELILMLNVANLQSVGDRLYEEALYEAAKIIFAITSNWAKLIVTLVKLKQFQGAVGAAHTANSSKTWKEVCFACVDAEEFCLAQICGLNIIIQVNDLNEVSDYYQNRGYFTELISLMESGLGLERAHMGIFTELGVLYARYCPEKLMEHVKLFSTRLNIPKLTRTCAEQRHWKELACLYFECEQFENATNTMMNHSPDAWHPMMFPLALVKVSNVELHYKAVQFYLQEHPDCINDLLHVLTLSIDLDHSRVVDIMRKAGHLRLIEPYMIAVQRENVAAVNNALNEIYIEDEEYDKLRLSTDMHDNFDHIGLAQKGETHDLLEMRRIAAHIYARAGQLRQSVFLLIKDNLFQEAMEFCCESGDPQLAEELLHIFLEQGKKECFASCLFICYDLIQPDVVLELAWKYDVIDFAFPYLLQFVGEFTTKVDGLLKDKTDAQSERSESSQQ